MRNYQGFVTSEHLFRKAEPFADDSKAGVGKCGHWDSQLDVHGYCRHEDCRADRLIEALHNGKAYRGPQGQLYWEID